MIAHIDGATRVCGKAQGYLGLPVKDETVIDKATGEKTNRMLTAWTPTPDELARLNAGANVILSILGTSPPPQLITVGPVPPPLVAYAFDEKDCPGHVSGSSSPKICFRCGCNIDSLRPPGD